MTEVVFRGTDIHNLYDNITVVVCFAGAAIIRMVYSLMPEEVFRDAIIEYISSKYVNMCNVF